MIHPASNATDTKWGRGQLNVKIVTAAGITYGYCDGDAEDERVLTEYAEMEGVQLEIQRKALKSGREIWTLKPGEA